MSYHKNVVRMLGLLVTLMLSWATATTTWTVTNTNDSGTGSFREALGNAQSGDTIDFGSSLIGDAITLESNLPDITIANLTIDASGLGKKVTIDGDNKYRIFNHTGTGTLAINNFIVTNGFTTGNGGGIYSRGNVTVINSTISDNDTSESGGGISSYDGDVTVINSTISNNDARSELGSGGGIFTGGASTVRVTDSVITGNQARFYGGGIANDNKDFSDNVIITNSIISNNRVELSGGGIWTVGYIVFSGCTKVEDNGDKALAYSNQQWRSDGASDDNGALAAISDDPYIGDCPTEVVNTNNAGAGSLREAINNASDGDTITFDEGLSGTINLGSTLTITRADLTIDASGADITIDGQGSHRVFYHRSTGTFTINNLVVTNGDAPDDGGGGGILSYNGNVTVINSTISNNRATSEFGRGGGIFTVDASTVRVTNSVISGNQARDYGGGIGNDNENTRTTNVIITNSVISNNKVEYGGGGIRSVGNIVFSGCTQVSDNQADTGGEQWRADGASDDNGVLAAISDDPYIGDCPTGGSVINPDPDIQVRNGNSTAAASITSGSAVSVGSFKRGEVATVDFLVRNPGAQVLELGELSLPSFLSVSGDPLPETLASFGSALLTLTVDTSSAGALTGEFSLASNDPDSFENPFVFTITGNVSNTPANALNILPGVDIGDVTATTGEQSVVLMSFKLLVPAGSVSVTVDSLTLAASNAGIGRANNLKLYIDGGTRGALDNRDVFVASTDDTDALTFTFPARTFSPELPMWFIVVGDF